MRTRASETEGIVAVGTVDRGTAREPRARGMRRLRHLRDCGGFTVIEGLVAAFLFTVGLLATAQLEIMATDGRRLNPIGTRATN